MAQGGEAPAAGAPEIWLDGAGHSFGYNTLVVDFRKPAQLRDLGLSVHF